ncbi:hypothetical protein BKA81DRAFT_421485, partial [Phyllosticta paracitricarpa]
MHASAAQSNLAHWSIHGIGPIWHLSGCALATRPRLGTPRRRARSLTQNNREDTSTTDPGRARCLCIGLPVGCWCPGHVVRPASRDHQSPPCSTTSPDSAPRPALHPLSSSANVDTEPACIAPARPPACPPRTSTCDKGKQAARWLVCRVVASIGIGGALKPCCPGPASRAPKSLTHLKLLTPSVQPDLLTAI